VPFRVFGALEVIDVSRDALRVRSAGLPRLLTLLLMYAGTVVSTDRIADVMWGEHSPASPGATPGHVAGPPCLSRRSGHS